MDVIWNLKFIENVADWIYEKLDDAAALGDVTIELLKTSVGTLAVSSDYSGLSSHFATFKGYAPFVVASPIPAPSYDAPGQRIDITANASFAYDSGESGDSSNDIAYAVLIVDLGSGPELWGFLELDSPYTFSNDGHALEVAMSLRNQNPPWPV